MPKFIELTLKYLKRPILINIDNIGGLSSDLVGDDGEKIDGSIIYVKGSRYPIRVTERYEDIFHIISGNYMVYHL